MTAFVLSEISAPSDPYSTPLKVVNSSNKTGITSLLFFVWETLVGEKAFIEPPNRDLLLCVQEGPYEKEEEAAAFITLRKESIV